MFTHAIVRPPAPNFAEGLTTAELGVPPDYQLARRQHEAYCAALEQCGLKLIRLDADSDHPDSCFVEDAAVLINALPHGRATAPSAYRIAILARPGAASRRGEVTSITKALEDFFPASSIQTIEAPGTLDGGDVCEAGNHFFIGVSERTNEAGAQQLADLVTGFGCTAGLVDIRDVGGILHLKSGIAYLSDNRLVVTKALAHREEFAGYEPVRVEAGDEYAANCIQVNDHILIAAGFPSLESELRQLGYQTIVLDMSEFQRMDGGLSCLSLRF